MLLNSMTAERHPFAFYIVFLPLFPTFSHHKESMGCWSQGPSSSHPFCLQSIQHCILRASGHQFMSEIQQSYSQKREEKGLSGDCCLIYPGSKSHALTASFTVNYLQKVTMRLKLFVLLKWVSSGEMRRKKDGRKKSLHANRTDI